MVKFVEDKSKIPSDDPRFIAGFDLIGHTGANSCQIRYQDDEEPTVWVAVAEWARGSLQGFKTGSGLDPVSAILDLCEKAVYGGVCTHCGRTTGIEVESLETMPANDLICWYQFDPGAQRFIRGCSV